MNTIRIQKLIAILAICCITTGINAQLPQLGSLMAGGAADATKLLQAYLKPVGNSLGANLSAGWYNTAKVHKLLGVDLTFSLSIAMVPSGDKYYDPTKLGLTANSISANSAPTFSGTNKNPPTIAYTQTVGPNTYTIASFKLPNGVGIGVVPSPMLQLSIGLIKETALSFRFVPTTKFGNAAQIGLWGIGIQHGLKQWIPVINKVPFVNLTFQAGYTKLSSDVKMGIVPNDLGAEDQTSPMIDWKANQKMALVVSNFTANIIASVDIPVITVYGGVGISSSKTDLSLLGYYPIPSAYDIGAGKGIVNSSNLAAMKDPIKIHIGGNDGSLTKPRLSAGLKLKLGPVHIHGDYTYAYYSILSVGLGISIR